MTALRPGVYLEDSPPARRQWATRPVDRIKPIIVLHTAEGSYHGSLNWIRTRTTAGSYQLLGQPGEITQVVWLGNAAYHAVGFNTTTIGISGAMKAKDWPGMSDVDRALWVGVYAEMAAIAARWLKANGKPMPLPRLLTKAEAQAADGNGFISHARLDPARRTDPGDGFPWEQFFARYAELTNQTIETKEPTVAKTYHQQVEEATRRIQDYVGVKVDGDAGPKTLAAIQSQFQKDANVIIHLERALEAAKVPDDPDGQKWRDFMTLISTTKGGNQ